MHNLTGLRAQSQQPHSILPEPLLPIMDKVIHRIRYSVKGGDYSGLHPSRKRCLLYLQCEIGIESTKHSQDLSSLPFSKVFPYAFPS